MRRFTTLAAASTATAALYHIHCKSQPDKLERKTPTFKNRQQHLQEVQLNPKYDVLIVGGGCNGAGVLLDASTRGLRTLLIERDDFGSGASSKSTKLIHGGVRYLQQVFEFSTASLSSRLEKFNLVKQAIVQRSMMIDSASHLTTKIPFVIPCTNLFYAVYYYMGSLMYYWIYKWYSKGSGTRFQGPYFMNRTELTQIFPHLNPKFSTGVVYQDGSFNDARLLLSAVLTATVGNGLKMPEPFVPANAINRAQFVDFIKDQDGKINGATFRDLLTKKVYKVEAKYVVNCTGVWADTLRLLDNPKVNRRLCLVGGSHIVYDNRISSSTFGIAAPSADGRIVLIQPWLGRVLAGTTEKKIQNPTNNPTCSDQERTFINNSMMNFMSQLDVPTFLKYEKTRWSGIRPLVAENADSSDTKSIARNHVIEESENGLLSLMGGKWTIYRKMGEDLVNLICEKQKKMGRNISECQTAGLKLLGSAPSSMRQDFMRQKGDKGVQLFNSFGWLAHEVAKGNMTRVYGSTTLCELQWMVRNQLVSDIQDVLMRRTRLCFLLRKQEVLPLAQVVALLMKKEHGWSQQKMKAQLQRSVQNMIRYEFQ